MTSRHIIAGIGLLILTGCQTGEGMPTLTRSGQVKDVLIEGDVSPTTLTVNPGDEIRWINGRQGAASVIFIDPVVDTLSCERNFGSFMKKPDRNQYTAKLGINESASACFGRSGQIKYVIRVASDSAPGGEENIPGMIHVADPSMTAAAVEPAARDQETERLATALQDAENASLELQMQLTAEERHVAALQNDKRTLLDGSSTAQQEIARLQQREGELETEAARARDLEQRLSERDQHIAMLRQDAADRQAAVTTASLTNDLQGDRERTAALIAELELRSQESEQLAGELKQARHRLRSEEAERARLEQERRDLTAGLKQARDLLYAKEAETRMHLTNALRPEIENGDIKIRQDSDRLTINMVDRVLFDSGKSQIRPDGLKVLKQVSDSLRTITDKHIRIEGHTDNVPISPRLRKKFPTNWELSTARATSVVRYLVEEGGVDRLVLEADGHADTRPVEPNDTEAGKAANRRIDIVLYPKELTEIAREVP